MLARRNVVEVGYLLFENSEKRKEALPSFEELLSCFPVNISIIKNEPVFQVFLITEVDFQVQFQQWPLTLCNNLPVHLVFRYGGV